MAANSYAATAARHRVRSGFGQQLHASQVKSGDHAPVEKTTNAGRGRRRGASRWIGGHSRGAPRYHRTQRTTSSYTRGAERRPRRLGGLCGKVAALPHSQPPYELPHYGFSMRVRGLLPSSGPSASPRPALRSSRGFATTSAWSLGMWVGTLPHQAARLTFLKGATHSPTRSLLRCSSRCRRFLDR